MKITNTFHFAALWPETEFLANKGLVGIACTAAKPMVAPAGAQKAFWVLTQFLCMAKNWGTTYRI